MPTLRRGGYAPPPPPFFCFLLPVLYLLCLTSRSIAPLPPAIQAHTHTHIHILHTNAIMLPAASQTNKGYHSLCHTHTHTDMHFSWHLKALDTMSITVFVQLRSFTVHVSGCQSFNQSWPHYGDCNIKARSSKVTGS